MEIRKLEMGISSLCLGMVFTEDCETKKVYFLYKIISKRV